jgi:hypothetical protein
MSKEMIALVGAGVSAALAVLSALAGYTMIGKVFVAGAIVLCAYNVIHWMIETISERVVTGVMERLEAYEAASRAQPVVEDAPVEEQGMDNAR